MSTWIMASKLNHDGSRDVAIHFTNNDANGAMSGTLTFKDDNYAITGNWAASGSVPGRNYSAFALFGNDLQAATQYVAAAGTLEGSGQNPDSIQLNLIRASTGDDQQYGWDGKLLPV